MKYEFKGNRIKRGLYETQNGKIINADVNAAANIIKNVSIGSILSYCVSGRDSPYKIKL